jgi:hypothetical protein
MQMVVFRRFLTTDLPALKIVKPTKKWENKIKCILGKYVFQMIVDVNDSESSIIFPDCDAV